MRLLKLSPRVQQMIIDDMISTGHARALLAIDDEEQQFILANKIFDEKLSVRETEKLVKALKNPKKEVKKEKPEHLLNRMMLSQILDGLDKEERQLIYLRYFQEKTQAAVGEILGISQVQVSRMEKKILERMRKQM